MNDHLQRYIDDMNMVRERAAIAQGVLLSRNSDELNSRMYTLSVIATVFLPLSFSLGRLVLAWVEYPGPNLPGNFSYFIF
ncbi:CorA family divalent cation transporter [Microbulbifer okhotskensis]|uniref:CorA family divalent cation transporter n=1 Tax=Microbulbifer okhotskensis TaxID=2926617 RepID=UPI00359C5EB1